MATKSASAPKLSAREVNDKIKAEVTAKFLEFLEKGPGAWDKGHAGQSFGAPVNMATGVPYKGMNVITLSLLSPYSSNQWITYKQLENLRECIRAVMAEEGKTPEEIEAKLPHVRKGEHGTKAIFAKPSIYESKRVDSSTGEETTEQRASFLYSQFTVFNAEQIENCPMGAKGMDRPFEANEGAEMAMAAMIAKTGLKIIHGSGNYYSPSRDEIHLFPKEMFKSEYEYYSTAGHELIHSTLSPSRMDRREALGKRWGDEAYAMEELRAEIGAMYLSSAGIGSGGMGLEVGDDHIKNHAAYVASWRKALSSDPSELFRAVGDASKCADYVSQKTLEYVAELEAARAKSSGASTEITAGSPTPIDAGAVQAPFDVVATPSAGPARRRDLEWGLGR